MTTEQLAQIEARHQAANLGPTRIERNDMESGAIDWLVMEQCGDRDGSNAIVAGIDAENTPRAKAKAEFFAHARTDIPALVARVRELERDLSNADSRSFGGALYAAILDRLRAHYPPESRDLEWDVLPSTLAGLAVERDRLRAHVRDLENHATGMQQALALEGAARIELEATLANERGEGEGPSPEWGFDGSCWYIDSADANVEDIVVDSAGLSEWAWYIDPRTSGKAPYARDAMRAADLARAGGAT